MKEKILIALSDSNLTKILMEKLIDAGFAVDNVMSGNEVIEKLKANASDLLLIDTVLPDKNGYDVLFQKSLDKDVTRIPVIIISNSGEPIQMKNIPSTPTIRDYVIKSHVEPNEVLEKVNKVFGKSVPSTEASPVGAVAKKVKKILWVEDDILLSTILARKIESSGFSLLKANSGDEAMKFLETEIPDVIVLDIMLPGMNGMDILQKIKMEEKLRKIPVMMLTNLNRQSDIEKAKVLGANKFMVKAAASLDEIINAVNELIPANAK